eukprot:5175430-Pyramimonas_sp.AAC.1
MPGSGRGVATSSGSRSAWVCWRTAAPAAPLGAAQGRRPAGSFEASARTASCSQGRMPPGLPSLMAME